MENSLKSHVISFLWLLPLFVRVIVSSTSTNESSKLIPKVALFNILEPNIYHFNFYTDVIPLVVNTTIFDEHPGYYLCVHIDQQIIYLNEQVPDSIGSCHKAKTQLYIKNQLPRTLILSISIVNDEYTVLDTERVIIEYLNIAHYNPHIISLTNHLYSHNSSYISIWQPSVTQFYYSNVYKLTFSQNIFPLIINTTIFKTYPSYQLCYTQITNDNKSYLHCQFPRHKFKELSLITQLDLENLEKTYLFSIIDGDHNLVDELQVRVNIHNVTRYNMYVISKLYSIYVGLDSINHTKEEFCHKQLLANNCSSINTHVNFEDITECVPYNIMKIQNKNINLKYYQSSYEMRIEEYISNYLSPTKTLANICITGYINHTSMGKNHLLRWEYLDKNEIVSSDIYFNSKKVSNNSKHPITVLLSNGTFIDFRSFDKNSSDIKNYLLNKSNTKTIALFMNNFVENETNQRFFYWACYNHMLRNKLSKSLKYETKRRNEIVTVSHIITGYSVINTNFSTIYHKLKKCGVPIIYHPCLSIQYADICFEILASIEVEVKQAKYSVDADAAKIYALCVSCKNQIIYDLKYGIHNSFSLPNSSYSEKNNENLINNDDSILVNSLILSSYIHNKSSESVAYDILVSLVSNYLPKIYIGFDIASNADIPDAYVNCCLNFIITSSVYQSFHPSVIIKGRPILLLHTPIDQKYSEFLESVESINSLSNQEVQYICNRDSRLLTIYTEHNTYNSNSTNYKSVTSEDEEKADDKEIIEILFVYMSSFTTDDSPSLLIRAIGLIFSCISYNHEDESNQNNNRYYAQHNKTQYFCDLFSEIQIRQFIKYSRFQIYCESQLRNDIVQLAHYYNILNNTNNRNCFIIADDINNINNNITSATCSHQILTFHHVVSNQTELNDILYKADYLVTTSLTAERFNNYHIQSLLMLTPVISFLTGTNDESVLYAYDKTLTKYYTAIQSNISTVSNINDTSSNIYKNQFKIGTKSVLIPNITIFSLSIELMTAFITKQKIHQEKVNYNNKTEKSKKEDNQNYYFACQKRKDIFKKLSLKRFMNSFYQGLNNVISSE